MMMQNRFILILAACLAALCGKSQIAITPATLTYRQDFNSLDTVGTNLTAMPPEWSFSEWGGASVNAAYRASAGTGTAGDTYSYGTAGSTDRALGALCSSGVPNVSYGVRLVNKTSAYINSLSVTFKGEQWRRGGTGDRDSVRFFYSTTPGKTIADNSFNGWIEVPALLLKSITTAVPASAINGNDSARVISATVSIALPAGDTISIRWHDYNSGGNDDGLAIDSLTVWFVIGSPPAAYVPAIVSLSPQPHANGISLASNLQITFNKHMGKGAAGNIYIRNRTSRTLQTIAAGSGAVSVSGKTATISGIALNPGATYHVTFDSSAFDTAGFRSKGLYDTTAWVFSTVGGTAVTEARPRASWTVANPAVNGIISIQCTMSEASLIQLRIIDQWGRSVYNTSHTARKGDNNIRFRHGLPPGFYILRLDDGMTHSVIKVQLE